MSGYLLDTDICSYIIKRRPAHAVSQRATLITNNLRHFAHIPDLKVEVWT